MFRVVLCCAILASFSVRGAANPALRRECRAGACDDRPVCPQSPCRCVYPSKADCALYYQCVQGKPREYRCSQGLLFNEDTLTCDYDFNVNCSIGKITRTAESSTGVMTTVTGVATSEIPETSTANGNDTTTDHPSRSLETSTETSSNDASQKYSTERYRTTASNKDSSTETVASEPSDLSIGTANTTLTGAQSESYSKSTSKDDTTTPDSSVKPTDTSDFPTYSSSDASLDTTYSKSSDFVTEITNPTSTTKQSEVPKTTKSTSTTKNEESTGTASPVSMTEESAVPDTSKSIFTDKESEEPETTNPSTTKEIEVSETTSSTSTTKNEESTGTASLVSMTEESAAPDTSKSIFTDKDSEEPETTNPSTTKEIEVSETTSSTSTTKNEESTGTASLVSMTEESVAPDTSKSIFTDKDSEEPETTNPSTTKEIEVSETTSSTSTTKNEESTGTASLVSMTEESVAPDTSKSIFTDKDSEEPETTNPSTTKEIEVSETTGSTSTANEIKETETTSFRSTITTSRTGSANGSTGVTGHSLSTEEMQPEVTTNIQSRNWTCPSRFGLFPDESDCNKFYHCSHWKPYHKRCPSNLHFNPALKVCDWPENAGCGERLTTSLPIETAATVEPETSSCECDFCELPLPHDCNSYMMCSNKFAKVITCGRGLYFNAMTETCDREGSEPCENNVRCPESSGLFPYPNSCVHYMDCKDFGITVKICPKGMTFDKHKMECSSEGSCGDMSATSTTTHYSDSTIDNISEVSPSESSTTGVTQLTDSVNDSTSSSKTETINNISETTVMDKDLNTETTFETKATAVTGQNIVTDEPNTTHAEINSTFSIATDAATTDSEFTPENVTRNDELFSTQHSESASEFTTIAIPTDETSVTRRDSSIAVSSTSPESNATTHPESTATETIMISSKATSATTTLSDETSAKPEITSSPPEVSKESSSGTNKFSNIPDETSSATETTSHPTTIIVETSRDTKIISMPTTVQGKISTETISPWPTTLEKEVTMDIETTSSSPIVSNETEIISARISTNLETTPFSLTEITSEEISIISNADTYSQTEIIENSSTAMTNRETTTTASSSNENTEGTKDEKSHSIVPEITTTKGTSEVMKFECPNRFGLYPDPQSCFKFYQCSHWIAYHKACPSNLHFNPVLQVCDWPYRAGCGSTVSTAVTELPTSTPSQQTTTDDVTSCGCDSCELPVPDDCNSYILCIDKSATLISCGSGLNFNVKTGTCDWEENVVCETGQQCPRPTGRFPYPQSCYHFMDCNNTVMTVNKCPEGSVYSRSEGKCSWTAVCDDIYTSTEKTSSAKYEGTTVMEISTRFPNSVETEKETSTEEAFTTYRDDTSSKRNRFSTSRTMSTKRADGTTVTSSPFHPSTTPTERDVFSTTYEDTTTTEDLSTDRTTVSDENDITTTLSPLTSTDFTQTSKSRKTPTSQSNITEKFTVIPTTASMPSESLPVSSNQDLISTHSTEFGTASDSFYTETDLTYSSMEASTLSPAAELIISTEINANASTSADASSFEIASSIADETTANSVDSTDASTKRLVTIKGSSTEISKLPSTEVHSAITELTESSTNTTSKITEDYPKSTRPEASNMTLSTTEASANSSFVCPSRFGLFPDPDTCFRFYHCSHWVAHHKWCPSGLHFSPKLQVCDWPYRAGCGGSPVAPTSETIQPTQDDVVLNETCDCECCFYPNKTDCSKYLLCLDGVPHRGQCAEGLLFNHLDDNCDIAERVTCLQTSSSCPAQNGNYPHPSLCTSFYKCVNGHPFLERCPEDKHFKASERKCVDPCDADCDKTLSCDRPRPPPTCAESDGLLSAEGDCSSYYQCAEGHAYFVKCPDGSHFNSEYGVCEPPCDARCDPTIDCPSPVQHANGKSLAISSPRCPKPNGLFPAAEDCAFYYLCTKGRAHLLRCPPGLHYSSKDETCETPCNAQCDKNIDCALLKSGRPRDSLAPSSHLPLWLLCKILNNGTFPNPKNCTSFYACSEGRARLAPCPRGLHFDREDKECKSPCLAGCDPSIQCPFEIPVPKGKCSCENCYLQDPADCSAYLFCSRGFLTKGYCPRGTLFDRSSSECRNASEVLCEAIGDPAMCRTPSGNFPHPGNCNQFIRCEDSVAHITDCEDGLEFDPAIRACANPKGHCDPRGEDPICEEATGQFAHPNNSSLFYRCENGVKYLKSCSRPLIYNAWDQVCDWPHNVQDKSIEEILKTQGIMDEITEYGSALSAYEKSADPRNSDDPSCLVVPGVTCPCACRVTTYDDCDSFYRCRGDGKACKRRCPDGLYFNRKAMVCDLPQNVECRDFFFATLRRLQSPNVVKASLVYPFQAVHL